MLERMRMAVRAQARHWLGALRVQRWLQGRGTWLLIGVLLLVSGWARMDAASTKQCLVHDEAVSLLAAAGKLGEYNQARRHLTGRWVSGSEWRQYIEISEPWVFGEIQAGASKTDVHPPLYYWLLHVAGVAGGALEPHTGALLNTLLHAFGLIAVLAVMWRTTGSPAWAIFAGALWTFSATALSTTFVARQYELLAVLGVAVAWAVLRLMVSVQRSWLWASLLWMLLVLALLTHLHGALLVVSVVASAVLGLVQRVARRWRSLVPAFQLRGCVLALAVAPLAVGAFLVLHPAVFQQVDKLRGREQAVSDAGVEQRLTKAATSLAEMFDLGDLGAEHSTLVLVLTAALAVLPLSIALVRLLHVRETERTEQLAGTCVALLFFLIIAVGTLGSYVAFISQRHAMGDRYLGLVWPFLAMSLAYAGWLGLPRGAGFAVPPLVLAVMLLGFGWRWRSPYLCEGTAAFAPDLQLATNVVVDTSARGHLGQLLPHLRPAAQVFVAHGPKLRSKRNGALAGLQRTDAATLIHMGGYGVSSRDRQTLLGLARDAGLQLEPGGGLGSLLRAEDDLVSLVVGRGNLRRALGAGFLRRIRDLGGPTRAPEAGTATWLLRGGRVIAHERADDGRLSITDIDVARLGTSASVHCTPSSCLAELDGVPVKAEREGLEVLVRSLRQKRTLLETHLPPEGGKRAPRNMWAAVKRAKR